MSKFVVDTELEHRQILDRIVIIGRSGSGKSTLAKRLGKELRLPTFHTDHYGWQAGWRQTPFEEYRHKIQCITETDRWVLEGNSPRTFDIRFPRADVIIWLDLPLWRCLVAVMVRTTRYLGRTRPTIPLGCRDAFRWTLFQRLFAFDCSMAPKIHGAIEAYGVGGKLLMLESIHEARRLTARDIQQRLAKRTLRDRGTDGVYVAGRL